MTNLRKPKTTSAPADAEGSLIMQLKHLVDGCNQKKASDATVAQELTSLLRQWQRGPTPCSWPAHQEVKPDSRRKADNMQSFYNQDSKRRKVGLSDSSMAETKRTIAHVTGFAVGEWTIAPKVVSPNVVLKALGENKDIPGNLVVARNMSQVNELRDMWLALSCQLPRTVLLDSAEVSQVDGTPLRLSVRRAKSMIARLETLKAWRFGDQEKCPWVSQAKTTDFSSFKPPPKVTVRISAPQHFRLAYTDGHGDQTSTDIVRKLANWKFASTAQFLGGAWKWEQGRRAAQ
jgi:hypothetical protein